MPELRRHVRPLGTATKWSYSAFGPVSGWSGCSDVWLPAGMEVEPLASLRGWPPTGTSVPSWAHRVCQ